MTGVLRAVAVAIALAGAVDPGWPYREQMPLPVEFRVGPSAEARAALDTLRRGLGEAVIAASPQGADAVVVVEDDIDPSAIRENVSVSFLIAGRVPNVRLLSARVSGRLVARQDARLELRAEAHGFAGQTSRLTVMSDGVEVGRIHHTWTSAGVERIGMPVEALASGRARFTVAAEPLEGETRRDDNAAEGITDIEDVRLRVAFFEPRPSWAAGLVRRVIEQDRGFEVASIVRPSRGIEIRTPAAPRAITSASLAVFDAVVVGAPEELRRPELDALRAFMTDRGGTVVLLPDRRPAGPYAGMVADGFDEVLLSSPAALHAPGGARGPRASELALIRGGGHGLQPLASLPDGRTAIAARASGTGTLLFSGALDAWRYRADQGEPFAAFWRGALAAAALAAPPRMSVTVHPAVARGSRSIEVQVRFRKSELEVDGDGTMTMPAVGAVAVPMASRTAAPEPVRLWPTGEIGVLEGRFVPAADGDYEVIATSASGARARATLRRSAAVQMGVERDVAAAIASATGGVASENPAAIVRHLQSLPRRHVETTAHPMRNGWWAVPFSLVLCAEWTLRRRAGRR